MTEWQRMTYHSLFVIRYKLSIVVKHFNDFLRLFFSSALGINILNAYTVYKCTFPRNYLSFSLTSEMRNAHQKLLITKRFIVVIFFLYVVSLFFYHFVFRRSTENHIITPLQRETSHLLWGFNGRYYHNHGKIVGRSLSFSLIWNIRLCR